MDLERGTRATQATQHATQQRLIHRRTLAHAPKIQLSTAPGFHSFLGDPRRPPDDRHIA